ncbi:hypothetical protein HMF3257_02960 [Spirosoma telluris]|uniref:Uncharacterized protein n=1 Tax=Spirosoma telluris TaxID=2183553 RepID=A0A327NEP7_9BACT|nr:hypothetical protein HMF3257_02960 [Spirosoma telluris]
MGCLLRLPFTDYPYMDSRSLRSQQLQSKPLESQYDVADWAESLATFYDYYNKVEACLQENKCGLGVGHHLSIYSQDTLVSLMTGMQAELQMLFQDIDKLSPHTAGSEIRFNKKLATHTKYLTQLNQQAFLLLFGKFPN